VNWHNPQCQSVLTHEKSAATPFAGRLSSLFKRGDTVEMPAGGAAWSVGANFDQAMRVNK